MLKSAKLNKVVLFSLFLLLCSIRMVLTDRRLISILKLCAQVVIGGGGIRSSVILNLQNPSEDIYLFWLFFPKTNEVILKRSGYSKNVECLRCV